MLGRGFSSKPDRDERIVVKRVLEKWIMDNPRFNARVMKGHQRLLIIGGRVFCLLYIFC